MREGKQLSLNDLLDVAMQLEKDGEEFYKALADRTEDAVKKGVFKVLADEESSHFEIFEKMQSDLEIASGDKAKHSAGQLKKLYAIATRDVFGGTTNENIFNKARNYNELLNYALECEDKSINFYDGLREQIRESAKVVIEKIIDEERTHVEKLLMLQGPG